MRPLPLVLVLMLVVLDAQPVAAMGLRAFVALPLEQGGTVVRPLVEHSDNMGATRLTAEVAYGLSATQTVIAALPYRVAGGGGPRTGELMAFYRHQLWSADTAAGTTRWSLLAGAVADREGRARPQLGSVATWFHHRHEIDADLIVVDGRHGTPARGRYDLSWQYHLNPGAEAWWMSVLEFGGRWQDGASTTQQVTVGVQRIEGPWVIEGGVVHDLNNRHDTAVLLGARVHF